MKTILTLFILCAFRFNLSAGDDKIVRDATGKVVATIDHTATGVTVRDSTGRLTESRERHGNHVTVRDSSGRVIREEDKARK